MTEKTEYESGRNGAMIGGGLVYVGVVLAATTLFISFILTAFPEDAYFTRFVMGLAGLLVGGSMLAFPIALHNWAVSGSHRLVATGLYYGEMAIVALNTIVSFAALLGKYAGYEVPAWVSWYEPFSIVAIVYTLAAWGTVFQMDPTAKAKAKQHEAEQRFKVKVAEKMAEYLDTVEGEEDVIRAARVAIKKNYSTKDPEAAPAHFGRAREVDQVADQLFKRKAADTSFPDGSE